MSETLKETLETERAERPVLRRTFVADFAVEGRTAHVRIVPFGEVARVADPPLYEPYEEEWLPGVFDHQLNAANRVLANFEHQPGIGGIVGHGIELRREVDGYHGAFRVHETSDGEKTLVMLREKVLPGVSVEAIPVKSIRTANGLVQRVKANLKAIAFCRTPAFAGSQVLAVREEISDEIVIDADLLPLEYDPELVARCQKLGVRLPERYKAHPADTGTPPQGGTPEDGTRLDGSQIESSEGRDANTD